MPIENIEDVVRDGVDLARGNFAGQDLSNRTLSGGKFHACDFTKADLSDCTLCDADFTDAILIGVDLDRASLEGANFSRADLTGARMVDAAIESAIFVDCVGLIDAGTDPRGYRFIGVQQTNGAWRIKAGCRWYTLGQAIEHWQDRGNEDAIERVSLIAARSRTD
jgi:uncharacterized protein YjbI with pentapeptide repeats